MASQAQPRNSPYDPGFIILNLYNNKIKNKIYSKFHSNNEAGVVGVWLRRLSQETPYKLNLIQNKVSIMRDLWIYVNI